MMNTLAQLFIKRDLVQNYPQWTSFFILIFSSFVSLAASPLFELWGMEHHGLYFAITIGILAGLMSYFLALPVWWQRINSGFALLVFIFYSWQLPTWIYLTVFTILLAIYWNTLMTRVPYYPSNLMVWEAVEKLLPTRTDIKVLEIGSGMGGFSRYLSKRNSNTLVTGLETAPLPWLISYILAKLERAPCHLKRKNYIHEDFSQYDLIYAFLSPAAMAQLHVQAQKELHHEACIVSYMFAWPITAQSSCHTVPLNSGETLYIYCKKTHHENSTGTA